MQKERAVINYAEELGGVEVLQATYHTQTFSRHSHEGYCVGVIEEGAQCFYRTGGNHIAPQDSIILVNADEVHTGHSATEEGWSYQALYPLPEMFESVSRGSESGTFAPYFSDPVVYDPELAQLLRMVIKALTESQNRLYRETLLQGAMWQLMNRHGKQRGQLTAPSTHTKRQVQRVRAFLKDCPEENVSLTELANLVSLSPHYLARRFKVEVGMPPHAYQLQMRLRKAKALLREGLNAGEVAIETGFHDQSHFHRHFKAAMGVTPNQYRTGALHSRRVVYSH
ncbi:AraC family transcriptional regulator [Thaumasiovibrio subtropicus]|uniref:AraC family transcriptional regulator n=1 Tax=Thaumasiovibrio subtropicus TaxID=1891207 RepID=UPI000B363B39|nr:AraC family transcriptional regulator [Thaumasiovibrio subtropicus]